MRKIKSLFFQTLAFKAPKATRPSKWSRNTTKRIPFYSTQEPQEEDKGHPIPGSLLLQRLDDVNVALQVPWAWCAWDTTANDVAGFLLGATM
jgi:hypothetical protein